ncbi:MAG: glycosyltransferase, partial [Lachnospiraceae bacterium]|nr:glycosyltransferase [Lachnospiraceae bacterium]
MAQISVIVPIYLVETYLPRCIDSILNQTFQDYELILVDDGSTDSCPAICDEYAMKDDRITVIHQENGGLSAARNTGIEWTILHSKSQWITFVDSDDWIHPRMLELLLAATYECGTEISICRFEKTDGDRPETSVFKNPYKLSAEQIWISEPIPMTAWGKLYKINCFSNIRYPVG